MLFVTKLFQCIRKSIGKKITFSTKNLFHSRLFVKYLNICNGKKCFVGNTYNFCPKSNLFWREVMFSLYILRLTLNVRKYGYFTWDTVFVSNMIHVWNTSTQLFQVFLFKIIIIIIIARCNWVHRRYTCLLIFFNFILEHLFDYLSFNILDFIVTLYFNF